MFSWSSRSMAAISLLISSMGLRLPSDSPATVIRFSRDLDHGEVFGDGVNIVEDEMDQRILRMTTTARNRAAFRRARPSVC